MVADRLRENNVYAEILDPKVRCLRLNYAGQFHLDIIPACTDLSIGGTYLLVPDCHLKKWNRSNPKGFAAWFERKCQVRRMLAEKRIEPLLPEQNPNGKAALKRVVQLMKRHRDVAFRGSPTAPSSVILTTLAGEEYGGEPRCSDAMEVILNGIARRIDENPGIVLQVGNPSHPAENLTAAWSLERYGRFQRFIYTFRDKFEKLKGRVGLDGISDTLNDLFGEEVTKKSVRTLTERLSQARDAGRLGFGGVAVGLTTVSGTRPVPRNTFFGK